jgi:coproporphyrinogen III oxidase
MSPPEQEEREATLWLHSLRDRFVQTLEELESEGSGPGSPEAAPGRFALTQWTRRDHSGAPGGGGVVASLRGRVFEKACVHVSSIFGSIPPRLAGDVSGMGEEARFRACGVSLTVHPWSPHVPMVRLNAWRVVTRRVWFGGGADLAPTLERRRRPYDRDALDFHAALAEACARHSVADYQMFKSLCDDAFTLSDGGRPCGIGGVAFDHLRSGDGATADLAFAFTRDIGETLAAIYPRLVRRNRPLAWNADDREEQLLWRGRIAEFNLLREQGKIFGLRVGGSLDPALLAMPPSANWA